MLVSGLRKKYIATYEAMIYKTSMRFTSQVIKYELIIVSDPAVCRVGVGKQCLKMFLRIIWMVPKEYHCSYWEQEIKYNVTVEIPGKNLVKYKIYDDKRCQDQEYRHSSIYAVI